MKKRNFLNYFLLLTFQGLLLVSVNAEVLKGKKSDELNKCACSKEKTTQQKHLPSDPITKSRRILKALREGAKVCGSKLKGRRKEVFDDIARMAKEGIDYIDNMKPFKPYQNSSHIIFTQKLKERMRETLIKLVNQCRDNPSRCLKRCTQNFAKKCKQAGVSIDGVVPPGFMN